MFNNKSNANYFVSSKIGKAEMIVFWSLSLCFKAVLWFWAGILSCPASDTFLTPSDTFLTLSDTFLTPSDTFLTLSDTFLTPSDKFHFIIMLPVLKFETVLTVCNCPYSLWLSCQSATDLTVFNGLDSLHLAWQSATVWTVFNCLDILQRSWQYTILWIGHSLGRFSPCFS